MSTPEAAQKPEAQPFSRPLLLLLVAWLVMLYFRDQQRKSTFPQTPHTSPTEIQPHPYVHQIVYYSILASWPFQISRGV